MADTLRQLHAHVHTHTGTHTPHTVTGAALLWHVQLWQLVFLSDLSPCVMTQRQGDERTGRDTEEETWGGRRETLTGGTAGITQV